MSSITKQHNDAHEMPPATALKFVASKKQKVSKADSESRKPGEKAATTEPTALEEKQHERPTDRTGRKSVDKKRLRYEPFSTRLRDDIKRRLKRLSHFREDNDHEVRTVQQFVNEALIQWLAKQDEPELR